MSSNWKRKIDLVSRDGRYYLECKSTKLIYAGNNVWGNGNPIKSYPSSDAAYEDLVLYITIPPSPPTVEKKPVEPEDDGVEDWRNSEGKDLFIKKMPDEYLSNAIALLERSAQRVSDSIAVYQLVSLEDENSDTEDLIESSQYILTIIHKKLKELNKEKNARSKG